MARQLYFDSGGVLTKDRTMTLAYGTGLRRFHGGLHRNLVDHARRTSSSAGMSRASSSRIFSAGRRSTSKRTTSTSSTSPSSTTTTVCFGTAAASSATASQQFPINVKGCRSSSLCNLGCPNGAKQGTHRVQLPAAEAAGVEVITNCRVTRVGEGSCEAVVADPGFGLPSPWEPGEYRINAKVIVVCGGAINSSALLLRSGFGDRLPNLGRIPDPAPGPHPRRRTPAGDLEFPRPPQELLLRRVLGIGEVPARNLHVLSRSSRRRTSSDSAPSTPNSCARFPGCR